MLEAAAARVDTLEANEAEAARLRIRSQKMKLKTSYGQTEKKSAVAWTVSILVQSAPHAESLRVDREVGVVDTIFALLH